MVNPGNAPKPDLAPPVALNNRKKIAVLISGRGSNMAALIAASMDTDYPALITKVISNKASAAGLATAEANGITGVVIERKDFETNVAHESAIIQELEEDRPDIICLAGYMRILSDKFVNYFRGRILNIHPSLLPSFKGLDTHHRALENGVRLHGCTVHIVTAALDDGPILAQAAVPVLPDDTEETLAARVLAAEHRLYPQAVAMLASGKVRWSGARLVFSQEFPAVEGDQMLGSVEL